MSPKIILGCKDSVNLKCPDLVCHSRLAPLAFHRLLSFAGKWECWEGLTEKEELDQEPLPGQGI